MEDKTQLSRESLLSIAGRLLSEGGPSALTLRAIGAAAGVSQTTPYRYFEGKDELLTALAARNLEALAEALRTGADEGPLDSTPLLRAGVGYLSAALSQPDHYRLIYSSHADGRMDIVRQEAVAAWLETLREVIAVGQEEGSVVAGDPRDLAAVVWALLHGLADLALTGHLPPVADSEVERLVGLALRGVSAEPAVRR